MFYFYVTVSVAMNIHWRVFFVPTLVFLSLVSIQVGKIYPVNISCKYILYIHGYPHSLMMSSNRTKILSLNQDLCMYIRWNLCDTKHLIYLLLRQTRYKLCTCRMYVTPNVKTYFPNALQQYVISPMVHKIILFYVNFTQLNSHNFTLYVHLSYVIWWRRYYLKVTNYLTFHLL